MGKKHGVSDAQKQAAVANRRKERELAESWTATKKGDTLSGVVLNMRTVDYDGRTPRVITIERDDGAKRALWESANLTDQIDELVAAEKLVAGAYLICVYDGEVETKQKRTCKLYTLVVV